MELRNLFSEEEIKDLGGNLLQQKAQEIKQRFDIVRNTVHQLRNNIDYLDHISEITRQIIEFDRNIFNPWNQKWNTIYRSNNPQQLIDFFNEALLIFEPLETLINDYKPIPRHSDEIEELKKTILAKIEEDIISLKAEISEKINAGINNLVDYKAELGLHEKFAKSIEDEKKRSNRLRIGFLIAFIFSLVGVGYALIFLPELFFATESEIWAKTITRISISIPLGFLSYFLFSQYRLYQIMNLKYTHIFGFIGGGATYLSQIIGNDENSKKAINIKLAEMFMEIDDIIGTMKLTKHPADESLQNALMVYDKLIDGLGKVAKEVSKIKG